MVAFLLVVPPLAAAPLAGQETNQGAWNSSRALELIDLGRDARHRLRTDGDLQTYRAETRGNVYFYVDPDDGGERPLIRTDQVAVDLYWMAPDITRQVIVGHQEEKLLPIRDFQYFLDRLTLVQYGFGDRIRVGEGMDVRDVPHPLAPDGAVDPIYDFRVADSVLLTLPDASEPIRVYEIEVRPKDPSHAAMVGAIHLDGSSGSLVRMDFTFTSAAYQDPRNDRVRVSLEYGLWQGRYWLPHEQTVEVRRELPQIDLGIGTIILAVLRTGNYEFDVPLVREFFAGPRVVTVSPEELEAFQFDEGPLEALRDRELARSLREVDPRELRQQAREALGQTHPSGLPLLRFHLPGASSVLRFNRAEGWRVGGGVSVRSHPLLTLRAGGGYAFGSREPSARVETDLLLAPATRLHAEAFLHDVKDLGPQGGADGILNTFSSLTRGVDYLDPYARDGGALRLRHRWDGGWTGGAAAQLERHSSLPLARLAAPWNGDRTFRPVRDVDESTMAFGTLSLGRSASAGIVGSSSWNAALEVGGWDEEAYGQLRSSLRLHAAERRPGSGLDVRLRSGLTVGSPPVQRHFLLGGRHTIPGHTYRGFAGRHYLQGSVEAVEDVLHPWLRARAGLWGGWTGGLTDEVRERWDVRRTEGLRFGATLGAGIFYDLLRVDVARGFPEGEWRLLLYLDPGWWDRL